MEVYLILAFIVSYLFLAIYMNSDYIYPINIGNSHEINVIELANIILDLTKSNSKIIYTDLPLDDPTNRKPDITKAKNILQWEPMYDLEKGLIKTIKYFRENK
jgi:nucleoside-diphosphate-sugar epimerase